MDLNKLLYLVRQWKNKINKRKKTIVDTYSYYKTKHVQVYNS